ncbi:MAG TPA: Uma2 family endonuclease [Gemmataceae bacterium]|nr:Uma2 family endonuclease [Gemmataceae bacterium]
MARRVAAIPIASSRLPRNLTGDVEPIAETPLHVDAIFDLFQTLQDFLAEKPSIFVAANMFWYVMDRVPGPRSDPVVLAIKTDVMVVKGALRIARKSFISWLENGAVPSVIVEIVSPKKRRIDLIQKPKLYPALGVNEYFCFDPTARSPRPKLQGWRLNADGVYDPLALDDQGRLFCKELGLYLKVEGKTLRLIDAATGKIVMTREEKADLADSETQRANEEKQRAEAEKQRADALELEIAHLKAQMHNNGGAKRNNGS